MARPSTNICDGRRKQVHNMLALPPATAALLCCQLPTNTHVLCVMAFFHVGVYTIDVYRMCTSPSQMLSALCPSSPSHVSKFVEVFAFVYDMALLTLTTLIGFCFFPSASPLFATLIQSLEMEVVSAHILTTIATHPTRPYFFCISLHY